MTLLALAFSLALLITLLIAACSWADDRELEREMEG